VAPPAKPPAPSTPSNPADTDPTRPNQTTGPVTTGQTMYFRKWSLVLSKAQTETVTAPSATQSTGGLDSQHSPATSQQPTSKSTGEGVELNELHITFSVERSMYHGVEATLRAKVHNLSLDQMAQFAKQYSIVTLKAGWLNNPYSQIFKGQISYYERGREDGVNTYLSIVANGDDEAINDTMVSKELPAGSTHKDVVIACVAAMAPYGVTAGYITTKLDQSGSPRARTIFGMTRDVLRDITRANNATSYVTDSKLNVVSFDEALPTTVIVLNSKSGMIGIPSQTIADGIKVTSLLNPNLKPGGLIRINERDINRTSGQIGAMPATGLKVGGPDDGSGGTTQDQSLTAGVYPGDGVYKIMKLTHEGDNRGQPWYTHIVTDKPVPMGEFAVGGV
jgi:hypothetical protein